MGIVLLQIGATGVMWSIASFHSGEEVCIINAEEGVLAVDKQQIKVILRWRDNLEEIGYHGLCTKLWTEQPSSKIPAVDSGIGTQ